ncbi:uncharacterized protein LOC134800600 [Cydia splendana]|uniref:uncharacterized protein LOC134800600 n=1 Tax=Cydia splendana TaxID=1100963 RepID=UPI00300D6F39
MEGKVSKWQDLVDVYRTDCGHAQARLLHKLNDEHILPEKIKKMKVKNCVRVFSQTMAGALSYTASFSHYADGTPVSATLANTAELVAFLDDLFDSVNGASTHHKHTKGKKLRTAVTDNSEHHVFWAKAIPVVENMKLLDHNGKMTTVPSLRNWVTTLKSFQRLWQVMKDKNIKIMRPRYFNSDAIENFFGRVRALYARNNDPTCHAFECTFKSLLITNFIKFHENTYNCEEDCAEQVIKIQSLFSHTEETSTMDENTAISVDSAPSSFSTSNDRENGAEQLLVQATRERLDVHSRAYTAGWVTRKVLKSEELLVKPDSANEDVTGDEMSLEVRAVKSEVSDAASDEDCVSVCSEGSAARAREQLAMACSVVLERLRDDATVHSGGKSYRCEHCAINPACDVTRRRMGRILKSNNSDYKCSLKQHLRRHQMRRGREPLL